MNLRQRCIVMLRSLGNHFSPHGKLIQTQFFQRRLSISVLRVRALVTVAPEESSMDPVIEFSGFDGERHKGEKRGRGGGRSASAAPSGGRGGRGSNGNSGGRGDPQTWQQNDAMQQQQGGGSRPGSGAPPPKRQEKQGGQQQGVRVAAGRGTEEGMATAAAMAALGGLQQQQGGRPRSAHPAPLEQGRAGDAPPRQQQQGGRGDGRPPRQQQHRVPPPVPMDVDGVASAAAPPRPNPSSTYVTKAVNDTALQHQSDVRFADLQVSPIIKRCEQGRTRGFAPVVREPLHTFCRACRRKTSITTRLVFPPFPLHTSSPALPSAGQ